LERPSWSPDGARVAVGYTSFLAGGTQGVTTVDVASGQVGPLGEPAWSDVSDVAWLADGSALVLSATEKGATNRQIWRIDFPDGRVARVTNDLTSYAGVSLSADSGALVTVQTDIVSNLWVAPADDTAAARQLTSGASSYDGIPGMAWTPDGRIVYGSTASGNADIWIVNADGSDPKPLTVDPATEAHPRVCGNGRFVVFTSLRTGSPQVWRMEADGSNPVQLSTGSVGFMPVCAPDAADVIYTSATAEGRVALWRTPLEGGAPSVTREMQTQSLDISPDGRFVAGPIVEQNRQSIAIVPLDPAEPLLTFPIFPRAVRWSPDGQSLTYLDVRNGVGNLWRQPLPAGTPTPITGFTSGLVYQFAWSPDGRQLALARGSTSTDVVLFSAKQTP
jgi:Tol biopolymer transport system component